MEELKNVLENYKNKTYEFGHYATEEEIKRAYFENKTFVFKAGFNGLDYCLITVFWIFAIFFLILGLIIGPHVIYPILIVTIVFLLIGAIPFIKIGKFLVIGRQGVYFKKRFKQIHFSWMEVVKIREREKVIEGMRFYYSQCFLNNGKKHTFNTRLFKRKEFVRKGYHKLFRAVIKIYWESVQNA